MSLRYADPSLIDLQGQESQKVEGKACELC